jgi:uncharacterized protein YdaU (DUF1376 family)
MPCYITDYLRDTTRLTTEGHGAYLLLIFDYWSQGQPLPDDDAQLAAITRLSPQKWKALRPTLAQFFTVADGVWRHKRVDRELVLATERITKLSEAGKRGAAAKHGAADDDECGDADGQATSDDTSLATDIATSPPSGQATPQDTRHKSTKKGRGRECQTALARKPPSLNINTSLTENIIPRARIRGGAAEPSQTDSKKEEKALISINRGASGGRCAPLAADAALSRDHLQQKLVRFSLATLAEPQLSLAVEGLSGADPSHSDRWWLNKLDKLMRAQHWDDATPSRNDARAALGYDPGPNPNADDYAFRKAQPPLMAAE